MTTYVQHADFRIVNLLFGLATRHDKLWCYPSQDKITELVGRFHGRAMSRRTACRHLGALERDGWLKRVRRHRYDAARGYTFRSTLYTITRKTLRHFSGLRNATRFIGAALGRFAAKKPCATTGTLSVPSEQNQVTAANNGPPVNSNKVPGEIPPGLEQLLSAVRRT